MYAEDYILTFLQGFFKQILTIRDRRPSFKILNFKKVGEVFLNLKGNLGRESVALGIALFVVAGNALSEIPRNLEPDNFNVSLPDATSQAEFVNRINYLTPAFEEDPTAVALALSVENTEDFLEKPVVAETAQTEIKEPEPVPEKRTAPLKYTVQAGDTLSGIGWTYGLKIASIKYANNLSSVNSIKPGQALTLPPEDLSTKQIAQAQAKENSKKGKVLAASNSRSLTVRDRAGGFAGEAPGGLIVPINHNGITRGLTGGHTGIDYRANIGTPVVAAADGRAVDVSRGWSGGYGLEILVDHGGGRVTRYAHLNGFAVGAGDYVSQGQVIAYSGNSGRSTGSHLHFELLINGRPVNPF